MDPNDPSARHLGFVIEDQPQSFAVQRGRDRVDLYGYMSMAVATMQVQEKEIADLKKEMRELKKSCATNEPPTNVRRLTASPASSNVAR